MAHNININSQILEELQKLNHRTSTVEEIVQHNIKKQSNITSRVSGASIMQQQVMNEPLIARNGQSSAAKSSTKQQY